MTSLNFKMLVLRALIMKQGGHRHQDILELFFTGNNHVLGFTCSKLTIETVEQSVKYFQS